MASIATVVYATTPSLQLSGRLVGTAAEDFGAARLTVSTVESTCQESAAISKVLVSEAASLDSQGIFVVSVDDPQVLRLDARNERGAISSRFVPLSRSSDIGAVDFSGSAQSTVGGSRSIVALRVEDMLSQRPIPGALVWLAEDSRCWGRTGTDGGVILTGASRGWLRVAARGYQDLQLEAPLGSAVARLRPAATELAGRVHGEAGVPLPRVLVELTSPPRAVRTSADGRFVIGDLPARAAFDVHVSSSGYGSVSRTVKTPGAELRVDLLPLRRVVGRVADSFGRPVAPSSVALLREDEVIAGTVADGVFAVSEVPVGTYSLRIEAPGFATWHQRLDVEPGRGDQPLPAIELHAAVELSGVVEDRSGAPLDDVDVFVVRDLGESLRPGGGRPYGRADARTDPDGTFRVEGVDPTRQPLRLVFSRAGYLPRVADLHLPENGDVGRFVLIESGALRIRVVDEMGQPAEGAEVRGWRPAIPGAAAFLRSDAAGMLQLDGIRGSAHRLVIDGGQAGIWEGIVEIPTGSERKELEVVLEPPWTLEGTVADSEGTALGGVVVRVRDRQRVGTTDSRGRFALGPLGSGEVVLEFEHERYESRRVRVPSRLDKPVDIVLADRSVRVLGRLVGRNVGGVTVVWRQEQSGRVLQTTTQADGSFDAGRLRPGRYRVSVMSPTAILPPEFSNVEVSGAAEDEYFELPVVEAPGVTEPQGAW